jgi:hypothetical protein
MTRALLLGACLMPALALAHPMAPAGLAIERSPDGATVATLRTSVTDRTSLTPRFEGCDLRPEPRRVEGTAVVERFVGACSERYRISVEGLEARSTRLLLTVSGSPPMHRWLDGEDASVSVGPRAAEDAARPGFGTYFVFGLEHLLGGYDHVLFLLGLLALVHGLRRLLLLVTAFTVGHSLSLAAAVLGAVDLGAVSPWVEVGIALSLAVLALRILREDDEGLGPWTSAQAAALVVAFGLLHGLGFAGAFAEVGERRPLALLAFNLGVEAGQLLIVLVAVGLRRVAVRFGARRTRRAAVAHLVGAAAVFWLLERLGL